MSKPRYEIVDSHHPEWLGSNRSSLRRAQRECAESPDPTRFWVRDRELGRSRRRYGPTDVTHKEAID